MNAILVLEAAYDVMVTSGHDYGTGFAISAERYATKLAEKLEITIKQARKCLLALITHGYIESFYENNSNQTYAVLSQKTIDMLNK